MEVINVVPGRYLTRNSRLVVISRSFTVEDAPQPGMAKVKREVWEGQLYKSDGKTPDTMHTWEQDGRYRTHQGVATEYDLCACIEATPQSAPLPTTEPPPESPIVVDLTRLLDYSRPGEQLSATLTRILEERAQGLAIIAMLPRKISGIKGTPDETPADCVQRLIGDSATLATAIEMDAVQATPGTDQKQTDAKRSTVVAKTS